MPSAKHVVNSALRRTTGYVLTRADAPDAHVPAPREPAPGESTPAREQSTRPRLPAHYDAEMRAIIRRVRPRTMTRHPKLAGLILAVRYVVDHGIPGEIVECGVWRGGSMQAAAFALLGEGVTDRELHLFDTFEGMPPAGESDRRIEDGFAAADLLDNREKDHAVWAYASLEDVREGMAETGYPGERVFYHRGLVEETVPGQAPGVISILRLDTDWYDSTKHELEHLYERLTPGGVLIIDDYGYWEGARRATDEFLAKTHEPLLLLPSASGRIAVKPR